MTDPTDTPMIDPKALETITTEFYTQILSASKDARARAQNAYTIASATAAALVAAGLFAHIRDYPDIVQFLGVAALAIWLLAAGVYLWIARQAPQPPDEKVIEQWKTKGGLTKENFVQYALDTTATLAKDVEKLLLWA